ncbi:MAG: hypothetical protein L6Q71_05525 [Planctomycetes bacterium]|nr:hypothetical protein [Planctomycetota bacterium]NUQ33320.1 hypothetical protein [Planctomycetaceae bacterium]
MARIMLAAIVPMLCACGLWAQGALTIETTELDPAVIGVPYTSSPLQASGGSAPYTWTAMPNLFAPWVAVDVTPSGDSVIVGAPSKPLLLSVPADAFFEVTVTDNSVPPLTVSKTIFVSVSEGFTFGFDALPDAIVAEPYSFDIATEGGVGGITFTPVSVLPPWLTLSGSTLSGTPATVKTESFIIKVVDSSTPPKTIQANISLKVIKKLVVTGVDELFGVEGEAPSSTKLVTKILWGVTPYSVEATNLPPGISLDIPGPYVYGESKSVVVLGTLEEGSASPTPYKVSCTVSDSSNPPQVFAFKADFFVYDKLELPATIEFPGIVQNQFFATDPYSLTGGTAPFTFAPSGMPPSIKLVQDDDTTFHFQGTVDSSVSFDLVVSDSSKPAQKGTIVVAIDAYDKLLILTSTLPTIGAGQAYEVELVGAGGTAPYFWQTEGLPAGIELVQDADQWKLAGVASDAAIGAYAVSLTVTDSADDGVQSAQTKLALIVSEASETSPLTMITTFLPPATTGEPYVAMVEASGGAKPYEWSVIGLPEGIESYVEDDRLIVAGTPEGEAATLYVKVTARDASNPQQFADVTYTLFVKAGEDAPEVPSDTGFTAAPADVLLGAAAAGCSLAGDGVGHCVLVALLALVAGMRVFKRLGRTRTAFERACCL